MESRKKTILAVSGSTRKHSTNEAILHFLKEKYKSIVDIEVFTELSSLPHFNPDQAFENIPPKVLNWQDRIKNADGVIICTPEYVFSLPGSLKNSIEWTVGTTVFSQKPAAVIVASGLGEKAYESLLLIMKTIEANITEEGSLLISGARAIINENGKIIDETIVVKLDILINSLIQQIISSK